MRIDEIDPSTNRRFGQPRIDQELSGHRVPRWNETRVRALVTLAVATCGPTGPTVESVFNAVMFEQHQRGNSNSTEWARWAAALAVIGGCVGIDYALTVWWKFVAEQIPTTDLHTAAVQSDVIEEMKTLTRLPVAVE